VGIPCGCSLIGNSAFGYCALREVVIPDGCDVGASAFEACESLTTVTIGTGCTMIGYAAFFRCTALASVAVPTTLKTIGPRAFGMCPALATIALPKGFRLYTGVFDGNTTCVTQL
jgi:hypothetical protein